MVIQWKKGRDGPPSLTCVRADGTRTWRRVHPFFPTHDLVHCAVESVFGFTQAFFGLVASGWSLDDFDQRGAPARLPKEALWAENMVGLFDIDRKSTRLNSSHVEISYAVFCLKKKKKKIKDNMKQYTV